MGRAFRLHLSEVLTVLWLSLSVIVNCELFGYNKRERFGCLLSPDVCTPPEDCDGLTGSCQVPSLEKNWRYKEFLPLVLDFALDLRIRGFDVDVEGVVRALLHHQISLDGAQSRSLTSEYDIHDDSVDRFLTAFDVTLGKSHDSRLLRRSVSDLGHRDAASDNIAEKRIEELSTSTSYMESEKRLQRVKQLVQEAEVSLAKNGIMLTDLTPDEVETLAQYLGKILRNEEDGRAVGHADQKDFEGSEVGTSLAQGRAEDGKEYLQNSDLRKTSIPDSDVEGPVENARSIDVVGLEKKEYSSHFDDPKLALSKKVKQKSETFYVVMIVIGATAILIVLATIISCIVYTYRTKQKEKKKFIGTIASSETQPLGSDYEELCRQHYASKNSESAESRQEMTDSGISGEDPVITRTVSLTKPFDAMPRPQHSTTDLLSTRTHVSRDSSFSSWSEEPVTANLDITTGHAVLSYMEDHLTNKDRLDKEWEEMCNYEADSITTVAAITSQNSRKNRSVVILPYDHNRVKLNLADNHVESDYINASAIIDNDPKRPLYIAAQGPLPSTVPDFWQMMWEQCCVAVVMLTPLVEEGINQCARYWPDEGSCTYHNFEIHLVSEHIWCEDYLVRSLYLKHLGTGETRTITQFHFLSWPKDRVPSTPKPLLELRRKVTKYYKGHNSPVLVHCSDGVGRTGTYILLDLAIDRMLKGAKEIDIAATLEHIRDQRVGMVANREQFEFALTAVAEEVNAILKTLLR